MKSVLLFFLMISPILAEVIKNDSQIMIIIKGVPHVDASELNGVYSVSRTGSISLPHNQAVRAEGKTLSQLAASIEKNI